MYFDDQRTQIHKQAQQRVQASASQLPTTMTTSFQVSPSSQPTF